MKILGTPPYKGKQKFFFELATELLQIKNWKETEFKSAKLKGFTKFAVERKPTAFSNVCIIKNEPNARMKNIKYLDIRQTVFFTNYFEGSRGKRKIIVYFAFDEESNTVYFNFEPTHI